MSIENDTRVVSADAELRYIHDGSDKVYLGHVRPDGANWRVHFEYGRRGNKLSVTVDKRTFNNSYYALQAMFNQLGTKIRKGYELVEVKKKFVQS